MHKRLWTEPYPPHVIFKWLLTAFIGGNVNAGGFMACKRFVTHATGFYTLFGIDAAASDWRLGISMLSVPMYFLFGVMIAAYFTDAAITRGGQPRFGLVMGSVAALLAVAALGGYFELFGLFGSSFHLEDDYLLLIVLSIASGLANSAVTTASGAVVRATHMTGLTTDLGIGVMRALFGYARSPLKAKEFYRNWLRLGALAAFALGSLVGAILFGLVQYLGFLLPSLIAAYVGNVGVRAVQVAVDGHTTVAQSPETGKTPT